MFVPLVPLMRHQWGTQKRAHTFFGYFEYYSLEVHLNCHPSQTSILSSQSSLYHKSVVHLCLYHMYHKCGTSVVHKRGLTRFLDILGIMHLMYVNIFYCSINVLITNIVLDSLCFISLDYDIHTFLISLLCYLTCDI